jgi:hypothetical protein
MSDQERGKHVKSATDDESIDDVEAHGLGTNDESTDDDEGGDDVEAHKHVKD